MRAIVQIIFLAPLLCGCAMVFGGDGQPLTVSLTRSSDGAAVYCTSGVYSVGGLVNMTNSSRSEAQRYLDACILACRKHGFVEDEPRELDIQKATLPPQAGAGNAPKLCQT